MEVAINGIISGLVLGLAMMVASRQVEPAPKTSRKEDSHG